MGAEIRLAAYTDAETFGGAEHWLATILAGLPPSFHVTVVAIEARVAGRVAGARRDTNVALVPPPRKFWDAGAVAAHRRLLRSHPADVFLVNLRTPYSCLHATTAALLVPGLKVVAVEHLPLPSQSRAARLLKRIASRRLAAHVAVSENTARSVAAAASLSPDAIRVVPNGVAEPGDGILDLRMPRPVIGAVGRIDGQKGLDVLVDALALLPDVSAAVAGDGRDRAALVQRAQERGVADRFAVTGWQEEVGPFLRSLDVFVLPSRFEGLSLALLEAMAVGAAIVATDVGGTREAIVPGETGLLVPPESAAALAEAVRRLLDDEDLRQRLGAAARAAWLDRFTEQRMQQAYSELLEGLVR